MRIPLAHVQRPARSTEQCAYLNGIAYKMLCDHLGYEPWEIRDMLCTLYWGGRKIYRNGEIWFIPDRTTTTGYDNMTDILSPQDFHDYTEFVKRFGAKRGVYIPDPVKQVPERAR